MTKLRLFINWVLLLTMPVWIIPLMPVLILGTVDTEQEKYKTGEKWMWE